MTSAADLEDVVLEAPFGRSCEVGEDWISKCVVMMIACLIEMVTNLELVKVLMSVMWNLHACK